MTTTMMWRIDEVISDRTWNQDQSWHRELIGSVPGLPGLRLRVYVRKNAYERQSFGRAEVWSIPLQQWSEVHRIPGVELKTDASYVKSKMHPGVFVEDLNELIEVATRVLHS